jgi:acetyl esterase/lipase
VPAAPHPPQRRGFGGVKPTDRRTRKAKALVGLAVIGLVAGCGGNSGETARPAPSGHTVEITGGTATPYGAGAGRVWILAPRSGEIRSLVVYLHGWTANLPFEWHQAWFEHLLQRGSVVMFPAYQNGAEASFVAAPTNTHDGLALGFRALQRPDLPVVVAGYSVGATLSFIYAARAEGWGLPTPRAVYGIFPVDPSQVDPSLDLSKLRGTCIVLRAGDQDSVVGRGGADALVAMLGAGAKFRLDYQIVRSKNGITADHELPPRSASDPAVRKLFWAPLDALVSDAQRSRVSSGCPRS